MSRVDKEASRHPSKGRLVWTKRLPQGRGEECFIRHLAQSVIIMLGLSIFSGNGPNLYACLDVSKTHHRMTGIVTSSSKGCHELLQRDNIYTQYLALSIELAMNPYSFFYRDLQSVYN